MKDSNKIIHTFAVTGTYHGSIIYTKSEGEARKIFHDYYNGESIINLRKIIGYF